MSEHRGISRDGVFCTDDDCWCHDPAQNLRHPDRNIQTSEQLKPDFEAIARRECRELLSQVRAAFVPSEGIEAIVLVAFTRGAAWALDIDVEAARAPKS